MHRRQLAILSVTALLLFSLFNSLSVHQISDQERLDSSQKIISNSETNTELLGWANSAAGFGQDSVYDVHIDVEGFTYLVGSYTDWMGFNEQVDGITSEGALGDVDMFLGKIDENGVWLNATTEGSSSGKDTIQAIDSFENGDLLLAGTFCEGTAGISCNLTLGDMPSLEKISNNDEGNIFVGRYTTTGAWQWVQNIGNQYPVEIIGASVNSAQNSVIAFTHSEDIPINEAVINGTPNYSLSILELDLVGNYSQHSTLDASQGFESQGDLCSGNDGEIFTLFGFSGVLDSQEVTISSYGWSDIGLAKFSSGSIEWISTGGSEESDMPASCSYSPLGKIAISSTINGDSLFGTLEITNISNRGMSVVVADMSGEWKESASLDSVNYESISDIEFDVQGGLTVLGSISSSLTLGDDVLDDLDSSNDLYSNDVFLGYLSNGMEWEWATNAGGEGNDVGRALSRGPDGSWIIAYVFTDENTMAGHDVIHQGLEDVGIWRYDTDIDGDGILDGADVCPRIPNPDQANLDMDEYGDLCDQDDDGDRIPDELDDCPLGETGWVSLQSTDHDSDGCRDAGEDLDDDEDRIFDHNDACPLGPVGWISTPEVDREGDGCADYDTDEDGFVDQADNCPNLPNPTQTDLDNDGKGDPCDEDADGDTINTTQDNCPMDFEPWISTELIDHDRDGCRDSTNDLDDDGDNILDGFDSCPVGQTGWLSNSSTDLDSDGCNNEEDLDDDNDGFNDDVDNCPLGITGAAPLGQDRDNDGCIDSVEDLDDDGDGVENDLDQCPRTPLIGFEITAYGCAWIQLDDDGDGVSNLDDLCPSSAQGALVSLNGCEIIQETNTEISPSSSNSALYVVIVLLSVVAGAIILKIKSDNSAGVEKTVQSIPKEEE